VREGAAKLVDLDPDLLTDLHDLEDLVEPDAREDPMSPLRRRPATGELA
jgi:hypothetical protein